MSTTYEWEIMGVDSKTADGVVFNVMYQFRANEDGYMTGIEDTMELDAPAEGDTIIPYSDLTHETVISWVQERISDETIAEWKIEFREDLDRQKSVRFGKPWES